MVMEYLWINSLEREFHQDPDHKHQLISVYNDNEAYIVSINNGNQQLKSRHAGVRYFWIHDRIRLGEATLKHLPGDQMPADGLTKGLDRTKHNLFLEFIGLG